MLGANAQSPLAVDTSFRFYYPYDMVAHWYTIAGMQWTPHVRDLTLRLDGRIMATGSDLMPLDEVPWGFGHGVILSETGVSEAFLGPPLNGRILEIPITNQYFNGGNGKRYNYDGSIDWSFQYTGTQFSSSSRYTDNGSVVLEDRACLFSGCFVLEGDSMVLIQVDEWGQLDTTGFALRTVTGGANMSGHRIFRLANGQYLLTGRNWTHYDGQPAGVVVRLHHDGALDTSFHFNSAESYIPAIHEQEDGKIIMAGIIWMDGNPDTLDIVRIHLDGSLDTTFNNHTDFRFQPYPHSDLLGEVLVVE